MTIGNKPARILIVDDHPMVREALALRIASQPDLEVCGEAASEEEALAGMKESSPDLVIVDVTLKSGHGLDLIKRVRARRPQIKMLVLSGHDESLYAERCLRAGALGYLNKQESNDRVLAAIRTVLSGRRYLSPGITQQIVGRVLGEGAAAGGDPVQTLSNRELEVFRLIGEGRKTGAIARQLHLSPHTIDTHREKIRHKLGLRDSGELAQRAVQWVLEGG